MEEYSITSVAGTILTLFRTADHCLEPGAAPADARVLAKAPAGGVKKLLVYAPDAIGRQMVAKLPAEFKKLEAAGFFKVPVQSIFPAKTPVCYASMFSGLAPEGHGILRYEKPALACRTIFDALPAHGVRTAIVAVKDSSIDLIFRGRRVDYFSEPCDPDVTARALELLNADNHDCLVAYHQEYDDILHDSDPWNPAALEAVKGHVLVFEELIRACDKKWAGLPWAAFFAPDHGAHTDPATGKGAHGEDLPADMDVAHFWRFR